MSWHLMVIGQLGIALLGCCGAFGWYVVKLRKANADLFAELEVVRSDLETATQTTEATAKVAAEATSATAADEEAEVEAEAEAEAPATTEPAADVADSMDSGLKVLLQQFTQDSRDMMGRIDELEAQTRALIETAKGSEQAAEDAESPDLNGAPNAESQSAAKDQSEPPTEPEAAPEPDSDTDVEEAEESAGEPPDDAPEPAEASNG